MNQREPRPSRQPTQAAEGLPRWRWTLAEFERFIELGIFGEGDRVELIGGELVPMAAKGVRHENLRADLELWLYKGLPGDLRVVSELGWRPDGENYCEPDLLVIPIAARPVSTVAAREVRLLIEVADTSFQYDRTIKAGLYAQLGVAEYWLIDVATLVTHVHRRPGRGGYGEIESVPADRSSSPVGIAGLSLCLAAMGWV